MPIGMRKLSRLINDISGPDAAKRRSAAEALSSGDERAVYPLIKALRDENPGVQDAAMRSLINIGGEATAYMVLPLLREEAYLRNTAIIILKEIGPASVQLLKPLLKDKDDDIRKFAVDLICEIKECDYPQEIGRILVNDPNPNVRASAARAIGVLDYKEALPRIIQVLKDEEWVCFSALETLALMKDESSVGPVISLLANRSEATRYAAIDTLGRIGSPRSRKALLDHLQRTTDIEKNAVAKSLARIGITPSMTEVSDLLMDMLASDEWEEKLIAIKGLADLKEERAVHSIIDIAGSLDKSDPEHEERLLFIKGALREFECSDALIEILNSPSIRYRGREIAVEVLGNLRCKKAVPHIIRLLESDLRDIRRAAAKALDGVHEEGVERALTGAIEDEDGHVRKEAVAALGRIGDKKSFQHVLRLLSVEKYRDVIEEAVKALLAIDPVGLCSHIEEFNEDTKEVMGRYSGDAGILLRLSNERNVRIKIAALVGLGKIQDKRALERLAEAIRDEAPEVRKAAIMAMGESNCCIDGIKSALKDEDKWVRLYAVKVLGNSLRKDVIEVLAPMLCDTEIPVVLSTIDALVQAGGHEAFNVLNPLLDHEDNAVREKTRQIIDMMQHSGTVASGIGQ